MYYIAECISGLKPRVSDIIYFILLFGHSQFKSICSTVLMSNRISLNANRVTDIQTNSEAEPSMQILLMIRLFQLM